jgi:alkylhydroperoxidase/carboxymuconolactone decarboxylase family protein YurZ
MDELKINEDNFEELDARKMKGNFFPAIFKKAQKIELGKGLCIIHSFEPIPLYSTLEKIGYSHETVKVSENEFRVYFLRETLPDISEKIDMYMPLKPTAILNFKEIDSEFADKIVNLWNYIWGQKDPAIDLKTRLLLSLANGVGAGRMRQATREFIKAYTIGTNIKIFDELFAMFVWNQGVGYFASEIGPSALFAAYSLVKGLEEKGEERSEIVNQLMKKFGEENRDVSTFFKPRD